MNHPALTLGYRIEADGATVVYATDHEPHAPALARGERPPQTADECRYADFVAGADLLIHDAQFTLAEYAKHRGWGHSPVEFAVDLAAAGGVRRLALYHHDPLRDDDGVDAIVALARAARPSGSGVDVFGAAEGLVIELQADPDARPMAEAAARRRSPRRLPESRLDRVVAAGASTPAPARSVLAAAVRADGGQLVDAPMPASCCACVAERAAVARDRAAPVRRPRRARPVPRDARAATSTGDSAPAFVVVALDARRDGHGSRRRGRRHRLAALAVQGDLRAHPHALLDAARGLPLDAGAARRSTRRSGCAHCSDMQILDTPPEERFDRYTRIAAELFDVPVALVSLIDRDRQWFKSNHGLEVAETPRDSAFCAHTILDREVLQVPDTLQDARFADNPFVTGRSARPLLRRCAARRRRRQPGRHALPDRPAGAPARRPAARPAARSRRPGRGRAGAAGRRGESGGSGARGLNARQRHPPLS